MITFKSKLKPFNVPTNYSDILCSDVEFFRENLDNPLAIIGRLTGLNEDEINSLDLDPINDHLVFMHTPILEALEPLNIIVIDEKAFELPEDIGEEMFGQKLLAFESVNAGDMVQLLAVYLQPYFDQEIFNVKDIAPVLELKAKLLEMNVESVYSCVKFLMVQIEQIAHREKHLNIPPTPEQIQAGIKEFNKLGDFNTIDNLADGDILKHNDVLAMEYNTVFKKLLKNKITAKFEKKYADVMSKKK